MPHSPQIHSANDAGPSAGPTGSSGRMADIHLDDLNAEDQGRGFAIAAASGLPSSVSIHSRERRQEDVEENGAAGDTSHHQSSGILSGLLHTSHTCPTCGTSAKEKRPWTRKCCGEYPGFGSLQSVLIALGIVVAVLTVVYISMPANKDTKETNEISRETQEWMAWYTWRWQVCPKELAQNISSPDCEQAMNQTTPVPQKPGNSRRTTLCHLAARQFKCLVNAPALFNAELDSSKRHCVMEEGHGLSSNQSAELCANTTRLVSETITSSRTWANENDTPTSNLFPLPPLDKWKSSRTPSEVVRTWLFILVSYFVTLGLYMLLCRFSQAKRLMHWLGTTITRIVVHPLYQWLLITTELLIILWQLVVTWRTWDLTNWTAVDDFVDQCMSEKTFTEMSENCRDLFLRSKLLDLPNEVAVWSSWRAHIQSQIRQSTTADAEFVTAMIACVLLIPRLGLCVYYFRSWNGISACWTSAYTACLKLRGQKGDYALVESEDVI